MTDAPLKLIAFDVDDLAVLSAHLQGAAIRPSDIAWLPAEKRFAVIAQRIMRPCQDSSKRCRIGLHFERVLGVKHQRLDRSNDAPKFLLSMLFQGTNSPAGIVTLIFVDGSAIRLEVECLEAALTDLPASAASAASKSA